MFELFGFSPFWFDWIMLPMVFHPGEGIPIVVGPETCERIDQLASVFRITKEEYG